MSLTTYVETFDHPNGPDIAIHLTTKCEADTNSHTYMDLSQEEAELRSSIGGEA